MKPSLSHDKETVLKLLSEHVSADTKERDDVNFIVGFVRDHDQIFGKTNPAGHITGSALVVDEQQRILLTYHSKLQRWLQLGGHSEADEQNPAATAYREACEESGLQDLTFEPKLGPIPIDIDVHLIPARRSEAAHYHLDFRYLLRTSKPEQIELTHESDALEWVSLSDTDDLGFDPALSRAIKKARKLLNLDVGQ
jgi:8-oxo-dGTP pyrophosphatase MutT (NUDIX family)